MAKYVGCRAQMRGNVRERSLEMVDSVLPRLGSVDVNAVVPFRVVRCCGMRDVGACFGEEARSVQSLYLHDARNYDGEDDYCAVKTTIRVLDERAGRPKL